VPGENGIRRSKDLRAEIGKFPNLTNERKQMSKKTNFKRIALVAVASLGFGVLTSIAPASAAITQVRGDYDYASGFLVCEALSDENTDAAQIGEYLVGGSATFTGGGSGVLSATGDKSSVSISGPGAFSAVTAGDLTPTYSDGGKTATTTGDGTNSDPITGFTVGFTAAGVVQISVSNVTATGVSSDVEIYTVTVVASCATGVPSVANSFVKASYYANAASSTVPSSNTTDSTSAVTTAGSASLAESATTIANGGKGYIDVRIMDGGSTPAVVTTAGIFGATATNGAVVSWSDSSSLQSSTSVEAVSTGAQFNRLSVFQGTANKDKAMSTTVTITYNGVVYGSRTITFTGKAAAITIVPASSSIAKVGATSKYALAYAITDAAGNNLTSTGPGITGASSGGATNSPVLMTSDVILDVNQDIVQSADAAIAAEATGYVGTTDVTCGNTAGKAKVQIEYYFSDLSKLVSNVYEMQCSKTAVNYKASLDKASYLPGEIATLTITATDSKGFPVYDLDGSGTGVDLGNLTYPVSISLPQMTAVSTPTNVDEFSGGKKTYKFTIGSTEGSFSGVVDLPLYNSTTYAQVAQTVSYKVAASTATVSNADVLKSIVALIASINKQIQALQKLILKR
jgi:trimeric autotransporter adhesin